MSDILIKGMKMPKNCAECGVTCKCVDRIVTYELHEKRHNDCPLVEIPPHGRLIDADATISLLRSMGSRDYRREKGTIMDAMKMISYKEYTPTIIPAEEGET